MEQCSNTQREIKTYSDRIHDLVLPKIDKRVSLTNEEINTLINNAEYRAGFESFIRKMKPRIFLTITFIDPSMRNVRKAKRSEKDEKRRLKRNSILTDTKAIRIVERLFKHINQKLYGRQKHKYFQGAGCLEYQSCGQPHFHFLLSNVLNCIQI